MRFFVTFFAVIAACACTPLTGFCQTNFKNLAFEEGSLVYDPYPWINPTLALPNWNVDVGVTYNVRGLGLQLIDFYDSTNLDLFPVLSGRFSVYLQPSTPNPEHLPSISQMGTIPDGTKSLLFLSWRPELSVTFAGHPLELVTLSSKPSRTVMGANISQYSGQTGELKFTGG